MCRASRACRAGEPCLAYECAADCAAGEASALPLPQGTWMHVPLRYVHLLVKIL